MIIGTAGHIDHGKTSLVKALTGIETDRLEEEKRRGMSIDIGFAYIDLPGGHRAGIVDVPGHENFIRNMIAGVQSIDMVLLVVAADDGIMPQTREHLDIVDLLGVTRGIVVITKTDAVEDGRVETVKGDVLSLLKGRLIEGAPLVAVSSVTGEGIARLGPLIEKYAGECGLEKSGGFFRMPVDRSFTVKGFGTVATGTVLSGGVAVGDTLRLFPGGEKLRVRNLEAYGETRKDIAGGDRCAVNLAGIDRGAISRGDVLTDPMLKRDTIRFDGKMRGAAFGGKCIKAGERVHLHTGTADCIATLFPASGREFPSDGEGYVSFELTSPLHLMRGDRFVVRDYSAQRTLGGGTVLNPFGARLRKAERNGYFQTWDNGGTVEIITDILKRSGGFGEIPLLSENVNMTRERLLSSIDGSASFRIMVKDIFLEEALTGIEAESVALLESFHKENPSSSGMESETVRQKLSTRLPPELFREIVDRLIKNGKVDSSGETLRLKGRGVTLSPGEAKLRDVMFSLLEEKRYQTASSALLTGGERAKASALKNMVKEGLVVQLSRDTFITADLLERAKKLLLDHFEKRETITVIEYKDILGVGRKGAILILEYFDNTHLTVRRGDERILLKR